MDNYLQIIKMSEDYSALCDRALIAAAYEPVRITTNQFCWSPNGNHCAVPTTARLEIRDGSTLQLLNTYNCAETIQALEWSSDSSLIYSANFKKGIVEVWQLRDTSWKCLIDEGSVGVVNVCWSPDSRHLLTVADFHLRITVWSLINKTVHYIKHPKETSSGLQFSNDEEYMAIAERRDCKDYLSIFETKSWSIVKTFEVGTQDMCGVSWSPDDSVLAVWDAPTQYKVLIYTLTGECLSSYSAYQWELGIKCVQWSPLNQFLAIGSYDSKVRFINQITWKVLFEFDHVKTIESEECDCFKEKEESSARFSATLTDVQGFQTCLTTKYEEVLSRPIHIGLIPVEFGKQVNPKFGVCSVDFSFDGRYFASRIDNAPSTVWIWNMEKMALAAVLVHSNPIKDMKWSPTRISLALCTGGNHLYMWTPFGAVTTLVSSRSPMFVTNIRWNPTGSQIALLCKYSCTICILNNSVMKKGKENYNERIPRVS